MIAAARANLTHKGLWIKSLASAATLSYQDFAEKIQDLRQSLRLTTS